jgi:hypothetical protein
MARISEIRLFRRRMRMASFGMLGLGALAAIVPAWRELSMETARSGFWQYLSVLVRDPVSVASAWKDFVVLMAETVPAFGIAAVAASIVTFGASVRSFARVTT